MPRIAIITAAVVLAATGIARADVRTDCADDVKSFCSGVEPKGGKLRDCMAENRGKLSSKCKVAVADRLLEKQARDAAGKKSGGKGLAPKTKDDDE